MTAVRFLQAWSPYQAGEIAGFAADEAGRLVASGAAEYYVPKGLDAPPADKMIKREKVIKKG